MLVLTRRIGDKVIITGLPGQTREIKITVLAIRGTSVRLGFEVETEIAVDRAEIGSIRQQARTIFRKKKLLEAAK